MMKGTTMQKITLALLRQTIFQRVRRSRFWWAWRARLTRARRAWRYARGTMTADDAQSITTDCRYLAGWHPLAILSTESTLDFALEVYEDHPELARLVADACDRVGDKWDDYSESASAAQDWAMEKVAEYAAQEGIDLVKREGWEG
jgi:hypothetical protein